MPQTAVRHNTATSRAQNAVFIFPYCRPKFLQPCNCTICDGSNMRRIGRKKSFLVVYADGEKDRTGKRVNRQKKYIATKQKYREKKSLGTFFDNKNMADKQSTIFAIEPT